MSPAVASSEKLSRQRKRGPDGKFDQIPLLLRLKAKKLYVGQGYGHKEIAAACGITPESSQRLCSREGWTKLKRERFKLLEASTDARMAEVAPQVVTELVEDVSRTALRGMERVTESLERKGQFAARDFQSWTGGVKNLVSIMRDLRPGDAGGSAANGAQLNVFVLRVGDAVKPAHEASRAGCTEVNVTDSAREKAGENANTNALSLNKADTPNVA